jgi:hypothetical protein
MPSCHGCALDVVWEPVGLTVAAAFFPATGTNPHGACTDGPDGHCLQAPCVPVGCVGVVNFTTSQTLEFRATGGAVLPLPQGPWQGVLWWVPANLSLECGKDWEAGKVYDLSVEPGLVATVTLKCGQCLKDV